MRSFFQVRHTSSPSPLALPHLSRFGGQIFVVSVSSVHVFAFSGIILFIQSDVVISSYHEFQTRIDAFQHVQSLFIFIQMTDHSEVTAVKKHVCLGQWRAEGSLIICDVVGRRFRMSI